MATLALFVSMALCAAGSSSVVASAEQDLQELKAEIWAGFKNTLQEIHEKYSTYDNSTDFKDFAKPFTDKHGAGMDKKLHDFKQNHPEADVSPQSLITLSTEQTQKLKTEVASGASWLCTLARGPITMVSSLYCTMVFSWNMDMFNVWACFVSFLIPFEAVCLPQPR
jgi:hypothetical protein